MIVFRRIVGTSMWPTVRPGQVVVMTTDTSRLASGDIVVASAKGREVIKRVIRAHDSRVWLEGDNTASSTDSRHYGMIPKSAIMGIMKFAFAVSTPAPKLRFHRGVALGWIATGIMTCLAVIHLFRIDTFVPELSRALGGDRTLTLWLASGIVAMEVFALPFLMRMRLSTAARYVSGAFGVIVPLVWTLIAVWAYGSPVSTAQLGEFKELPSSWLLIVANLLWLMYAYFTMWSLGYDHRQGEKQSFVTRWLSRLSAGR